MFQSFQRLEKECLFGVNTANGKCLTPEEYIQKYIEGDQKDECKDKNCDIIITVTQDRD